MSKFYVKYIVGETIESALNYESSKYKLDKK